MAEHDPKQAITEYVSRPLGEVVSNIPTLCALDPAQPQPGEVRQGKGLGARPGTIRFFHERRLPDCQLHEILFEDEAGHDQHWLCLVVLDPLVGWRLESGAHIGEASQSPVRDHPYANLACGGWHDRFWAGGWVVASGLDIVRVRLISADGQVREDEIVKERLALFLCDHQIHRPVQVELYDRAGTPVSSHLWFQH